MKSFYVLRVAVKKRLENRGVAFNCWRCGKPIEVGSEVVSKLLREAGTLDTFTIGLAGKKCSFERVALL